MRSNKCFKNKLLLNSYFTKLIIGISEDKPKEKHFNSLVDKKELSSIWKRNKKNSCQGHF